MKDMNSLEFLRFWAASGAINKLLAYGHFALFCARVVNQQLFSTGTGKDGPRVFDEKDILNLAGCYEHGTSNGAGEYWETLEPKCVFKGLTEAGLIEYDENLDGFVLAPEACFR